MLLQTSILPPLPVAGPLAIAGLMLAGGKLLPRRAPDVLAILVALTAAALCATMALRSADAPLLTWFGGWLPRGGQAIGISFVADEAGAALGALIGALFVATLIFAWGYFDEVGAHFHVLMLLFMAAMIGFCLTHDVFNMFVWFEVMSVAAFALTGYALQAAPLQGAINFTVISTIGAYLFLAGIGLLYAAGGSLDMTSLGHTVAADPKNPVIHAAFVLMASGMLIKAAQVPFHFWLADAHAVAPSPVSVIFSGAMVALGVFGLVRLIAVIFAGSAAIVAVVHTTIVGMGVASALVGAATCLMQRHVKRMLAFSTISHIGLLIIALGLLRPESLTGLLLYMVGHGLIKAALFMIAGILLATCGGIDEIGLRGRGRAIWPAGIVMALGGLLLAGAPLGPMDTGLHLIADAAHAAGRSWLLAVPVICNGLTGAAILRATGRIFLNLGPVAGEEESAPTEDEAEKADRPLWLMLTPAAVLLIAGCLTPHAVSAVAHHATAMMLQEGEGQYPATTPQTIPATLLAWLSVALATAVAVYSLLHRHLPQAVTNGIGGLKHPIRTALNYVHSGAVGDYVAWLALGVALLAGSFAF